LLALKYMHSHGIVHRDMKLENILYDTKSSNHLKLIDFGFSKFLDSNHRLHTSCGTLAYIAPEVLRKSYTSQCDLWSLGVVTFILLSGHMPFHGNGPSIQSDIIGGYYTMKHEHWKGVSQQAQDFTRALLTVNPQQRLDAKGGLEHKWIASRFAGKTKICPSIIDALLLWKTTPKFHRACTLLMAWMLTNEQQALVRDYFLALDKNHDGAISFQELRDVMVKQFHCQEEEVQQLFALLDTTHHHEIHYSEFLAAMMATRIEVTDDLLQMTFHHFDTRNSGHLTAEDFQMLLGDTFEGESVETLMAEAHIECTDGKLSYEDFVQCAHACAPRKSQDAVEMSPSSTRRTFANRLMSAMSGTIMSRSRGSMIKEPSLPTLLPRDGSAALIPASAKPMAHFKDDATQVAKANTIVDLDTLDLLPPPLDDVVAEEGQKRPGATCGPSPIIMTPIAPLRRPSEPQGWLSTVSTPVTPLPKQQRKPKGEAKGAHGASQETQVAKACCSIQ